MNRIARDIVFIHITPFCTLLQYKWERIFLHPLSGNFLQICPGIHPPIIVPKRDIFKDILDVDVV